MDLPSIRVATLPSFRRLPGPYDDSKFDRSGEGADHLYREIRIDNTLNDANGQEVALKPVEVRVAADPEDIVKK